MATIAGQRVEHALEYAGYGWHVVPLHSRLPDGACSCSSGAKCKSSTGKHPRIGKNWQNKASIDEEQIIAWWEEWPQANVGVLLGRRSGIIDIECDTKLAEKELIELFGGEVPVCPTYRSSRGKHRIFQWRSDLPGGACDHAGEVELRLGNDNRGAQSVFPPSIHWTGKEIKWVPGLWPSEVEPLPLSDAVVAKIWNLSGESPIDGSGNGAIARSPEHWQKILDGRPEGDRNSSMASLIGHLLRNASDLHNTDSIYVLWQLVLAGNERNRPPLPEKELQRTFTGLLAKEGNRRLTEGISTMLTEPVTQQIKSVPADTGDMHLVIVQSDPKTYELHSPHFDRAENSCIILSTKEMGSGGAIRDAALDQAEYPIPRSFAKAWDAQTKDTKGVWQPSLRDSLIRNAERRAAPLEQHRQLVVAERLQSAIRKPRVLEEGQEIDSRGRPCQLQDGSIVFLFTAIWEDLCMGADKVTRLELSQVLQKIGEQWHRAGGGGKKFKRLSQESQQRLKAMLDETSRKEGTL